MKYGILMVEDDSTYNHMINQMFEDVIANKSIKVCIEKKSNNIFFDLIKNKKFRKYTNGVCDLMLTNQYLLYGYIAQISEQYENIVVLFLNSSFLESRYPANVLREYKKISRITYVCLYIDIVKHPCSMHANYLRNQGVFDFVYTVDMDDAVKYNMILWPTPYSVNEKYKYIKTNKDLYFCAVTKDRLKIIEALIKSAKNESVDVDMDIVRTPFDKADLLCNYKKNITVYPPNTYMDYDYVLKKSLQAECILEIVQNNQKALTLRPYEAIAYNRKLLTNNKTILESPYYNSQNMQYFENVKDIDWDWVKEKKTVEYQYKNEYSPTYLIADILERNNGAFL